MPDMNLLHYMIPALLFLPLVASLLSPTPLTQYGPDSGPNSLPDCARDCQLIQTADGYCRSDDAYFLSTPIVCFCIYVQGTQANNGGDLNICTEECPDVAQRQQLDSWLKNERCYDWNHRDKSGGRQTVTYSIGPGTSPTLVPSSTSIDPSTLPPLAPSVTPWKTLGVFFETPKPTPTSAGDGDDSEQDDNDVVDIVAPVVGAVGGVAVAAAIILYVRRRKRRKGDSDVASKEKAIEENNEEKAGEEEKDNQGK